MHCMQTIFTYASYIRVTRQRLMEFLNSMRRKLYKLCRGSYRSNTTYDTRQHRDVTIQLFLTQLYIYVTYSTINTGHKRWCIKAVQ